MAKINLKFESPELLNSSVNMLSKEGRIWQYADNQGELLLDIDNWMIECPSLDKQGIITDWEVNEGFYAMKLANDNVEGNYETISYPFAVSMIGQIADKEVLSTYLESLQQVFLTVNQRDKGNT
ncbi:MAG: hypothetical protein LUD46_10050, partial [Parabacteroides sp.]|nr:hypothetical protein [Parabacteroides sp.]